MSRQKTELEKEVDKLVRHNLGEREEVPSDEEVREEYETYYGALRVVHPENQPFSRDESIEFLVSEYVAQSHVRKRPGFCYVDTAYRPWVRDADGDIEWFYWERYREYLLDEKGWSPAAVRTIGKDTERILDYMADPRAQGPFERRGLVVASVQSGKTSNYIGLITRAADAGYKIIVVMAGVYNVLRNQTQERIEEGFTGFDISVTPSSPVGVGIAGDEPGKQPIAFTSRVADFGRSRFEPWKAFDTDRSDVPYLFVVKKNASVLWRVYEWLRDNAKPEDPLLLIDDEADNASINVKYNHDKREEDDPTRINGQIRRILKLFDKRCYVGYTATPYANILIDPNVDTDEHGPDLFPSGFIYTMEDSTDYFGAAKVFGDYDEVRPRYLRFIDDIDEILPAKHKKTDTMVVLPVSLKTAVRAFLLATAIRALNGERESHSTMMVNVSPFTDTQRSVSDAIEDYLEQLRRAIFSFGHCKWKRALKYSGELWSLHDTWASEYESASNHTWDEIQRELCETIRDVHVATINMRSNDCLEYGRHTEHVIVVGGYRLSRGLTLEGLVVSYYSRNARAYDALMQMSRWFGYRFGYEELCRVWMSDEAAGWYKFVADSTSELLDQLRAMRQEGSTPRDYRLRIRQAPGTLMVTARNKRGAGAEEMREVSLDNGFVETIAFDRSEQCREQNRRAVENLLTGIREFRSGSGPSLLYRRVSVECVKEFLESYDNENAYSPASETQPVLDHIDKRGFVNELEKWDVHVAQGSGPEVEIADLHVRQEVRSPGSRTTASCVVVGEKNRLAGRGVEKPGLTKEQVDAAEQEREKEKGSAEGNVADLYYRRHRSRPLLVVHPVQMRYTADRRERSANFLPEDVWPSIDHEESVWGWSISLPPCSSGDVEPVQYLVNVGVIGLGDEGDNDDDYGDND